MSEVVLSNETLNIFKKAYEINQSLKIIKDSGLIQTKSENNCVAMMTEIEETLPRDVCIYDMREFISVINIIEEPILDFSNAKFITIKSKDGLQKLRYQEANPSLISSYFEKPPKVPEIDIEVLVTEQQFKTILRAATTMKLEYIGFQSDGEKMFFTAFNKNDGDENTTNNFNIEVGESDKVFNMFYSLEKQNLRVLEGEGDCLFQISQKKISKVETSSEKQFWLTMDVKSKFGD